MTSGTGWSLTVIIGVICLAVWMVSIPISTIHHHGHKKKKATKKGDVEKTYERTGEPRTPTEAALCVLAEKLGGSYPITLRECT
jgi:hypothetical protein